MIRSGIITYIIIVLACLSPNLATSVHAQNWIYTHIGNQKFHKGQTDKAEQYYLRLLKEAPNNSRAMFNLADAYLAKGDVKGADSLYNKVTQIETNPQVRSMAWHEQYKQALRLEPHSDRTRYNLALCQKQLKESTNNKQQNKQQQKQQQQQKNKQNEQQQQQQQQKNNSNKQQDKQQTEQYMNLARQAERRALEKLKQHQPRQRSKDKNW